MGEFDWVGLIRIVKSFEQAETLVKQLTSSLPECIQKEQESLRNMDQSVLEQCSLMDLLICQLIMRMVEMWNGDIPDPLNANKKRRNRLANDENAVPLVDFFELF